ncbi:MAG: Vms1/Ankzf1 family peptidyl-tRNA hydrolase [Anaerolineae bacterium]
MVTQTQLEHLMSVRSEASPVLSLYLNTALSQLSRNEHRLQLRKLQEQVAGQAAPADLKQIASFFDVEYEWRAKSVVGFFCQEIGLRQVFPLNTGLTNSIYAEPRPHLQPLVELLEHHPAYGVVQVNRDEAHLFVIRMGQVVAADVAVGEDTKRHRQGGWAAQKLQRIEDALADQNLREAAHQADIFFDLHPCRHLILAGVDETVSQFQEHLSKLLQNKVVGSINLDARASEKEVIEKSRAVVDQVQQESETALVERLITTAAKGDGATLGLTRTLHALQEERVQTLVLTEGFSASGHRCLVCDFVTAEPVEACPYCQGNLRPVTDVIEFSIRRTLRLGGRVETVVNNPALREAGNIGAFLRF